MKTRLYPHILAFCASAAMVTPFSLFAQATVEPAGMKIVWNALEKEYDGFKTYNSSQGVYFTLALRAGDKGIINFDRDKSKLTISDGSKDLGGKFGMWNKASKDRKVMKIETSADQLPAAGTSVLELKGELVALVASKTDTKGSAVQAFKKGDKVELSDSFKFELTEVGKPKWGNAPLAVTFKWNRKIPELAAVRFYDEAGKEIESSRGSSSRSGMFGKYTVTHTYNLKKKVDAFKIEVDLWLDAETIKVPVDLKVGLDGLVKGK